MRNTRSIIIIGISSDIGLALARRWLKRGWKIFGTYRKKTPAIKDLEDSRVGLVSCDTSDSSSVRKASNALKRLCPTWDVLVMSVGLLEPISPFTEVNFDEWENSLKTNFTSQIRLVHNLLPTRGIKSDLGPCVLFFSGGGINNATVNFSAYTISKIATIKMCELLDAEISDTRFVSVGPGWVKTKIHNQIIEAGSKAGENYQRTLEKFRVGDFTPMERVLDCCDWVINASKKIVSGRNFNVTHDNWGDKKLEKELVREPNLFKLRKFGTIKET